MDDRVHDDWYFDKWKLSKQWIDVIGSGVMQAIGGSAQSLSFVGEDWRCQHAVAVVVPHTWIAHSLSLFFGLR